MKKKNWKKIWSFLVRFGLVCSRFRFVGLCHPGLLPNIPATTASCSRSFCNSWLFHVLFLLLAWIWWFLQIAFFTSHAHRNPRPIPLPHSWRLRFARPFLQGFGLPFLALPFFRGCLFSFLQGVPLFFLITKCCVLTKCVANIAGYPFSSSSTLLLSSFAFAPFSQGSSTFFTGIFVSCQLAGTFRAFPKVCQQNCKPLLSDIWPSISIKTWCYWFQGSGSRGPWILFWRHHCEFQLSRSSSKCLQWTNPLS